MVAEGARCDGSVAASGSAEVVECELRRPAVADEQSRLMRWRDSGQTGARLSAETCNAARCRLISRTEAGGRLRLAETEDARSVVVRRCAVWSVATQVSRLRDWKVTTCG